MSQRDGTFSSIPPPPTAVPRNKAGLTTLFFQPNGLRAGWRLLLFFAILAGIGVSLRLILALFIRIPSPATVQFSATAEIIGAGSTFLLFLLVSWIMARIEGRKVANYGLPARKAFGLQYWQGLGIGFGAVTLLLTVLWALGVCHFDGAGLHYRDTLKYATLWGITFLAVGFNEEFVFRGYPLFTLSTGIGFWPSAVLMSAIFAFVHYFNPNETLPGLLEVALWGVMACIILRRTGNLWLPIGLHTGWDWAETYFYGVADSGQVAPGHLLNTSLSGPQWLTGGVAGPEGSWLCIVMFVGLCFLFAAWFPEAKYPNASRIADLRRQGVTR
jgi:membrane protease YdiL (CAAX protease family)